MAKATKNQNKKPRKKQQEEVVQEAPKNPMEYSYFGDEMIEIPASLFLMLYRANDAAVAQGTKRHFPTALEWISAATGMKVQNPKEQDIKEGRVIQIMSVDRTFSQENLVETFEPWLFPDIVKAKDAMLNIHSKNVNDGLATKIVDIQKKRQEDAKAAREAAQRAAESAKENQEGPKEEGPKEEKKA